MSESMSEKDRTEYEEYERRRKEALKKPYYTFDPSDEPHPDSDNDECVRKWDIHKLIDTLQKPDWDPVGEVYENSKDKPADEAVKRLLELLNNGLDWEQAVFTSGINNVATAIETPLDPDCLRG